jgi:hypothetical protein
MTPDGFRRLALSLPEAEEGEHVGHPDFRVGGRIFATLGPDGSWGMVKLTPEEQAEHVAEHPGVFAPVPGGWGLRGATQVRLKSARVPAVRDALQAAWRNTAPARVRRRHEGA